MALDEKVYGIRTPFSAQFSDVYGGFAIATKSRKPVAPQSEISHLAGLELEGQFISDKGYEFGIRGFSLGIADGIAEKSLQRIQIPSVPGDFDGVTDGSLHSAGCGLEGFGYLGVEYLGDGIDDVHVVDGDDNGFPQVLVALDMGGDTDLVGWGVYGINILMFIKLHLL